MEELLTERIQLLVAKLKPRGGFGSDTVPDNNRRLLGDLAALEAVHTYETGRLRAAERLARKGFHPYSGDSPGLTSLYPA